MSTSTTTLLPTTTLPPTDIPVTTTTTTRASTTTELKLDLNKMQACASEALNVKFVGVKKLTPGANREISTL